ncbi:MAG: hypothetical protein QM714_02700 [Nocardioides sp.]|uniref:hypothetical protein n=1 Tax=Nocardioides sp. TaxID=35761 RepID=UPI0039E5FDB3
MFESFVRVRTPEGAEYSMREGSPVPEGCQVLKGTPATRPDGTPLPPTYPEKHGQKAESKKEND